MINLINKKFNLSLVIYFFLILLYCNLILINLNKIKFNIKVYFVKMIL